MNSMPNKQCGQQMTRTVSGDEELFISMTEVRTARAMPVADSHLFSCISVYGCCQWRSVAGISAAVPNNRQKRDFDGAGVRRKVLGHLD
jgi:hypothetical protein